jgi:hypothetical protein
MAKRNLANVDLDPRRVMPRQADNRQVDASAVYRQAQMEPPDLMPFIPSEPPMPMALPNYNPQSIVQQPQELPSMPSAPPQTPMRRGLVDSNDRYETTMQLFRLLNGVVEDKELSKEQKVAFGRQLIALSGITLPEIRDFTSNKEAQKDFNQRELAPGGMTGSNSPQYQARKQMEGYSANTQQPMSQPTATQPPATQQAMQSPMQTRSYGGMVLQVDPNSQTGFSGTQERVGLGAASDLFNRNFQAARQERGQVAGGYGVVPTPQGGVPVSNRMVAEQMRQGWEQGLTPVLTGSTASLQNQARQGSQAGNQINGVNIQEGGATIPFAEYQRRKAAMGGMR